MSFSGWGGGGKEDETPHRKIGKRQFTKKETYEHMLNI